MVSGGIHGRPQFDLDDIISFFSQCFPPTYILYSTLTRLFATVFSVSLSCKILPILILQDQSKCCFLCDALPEPFEIHHGFLQLPKLLIVSSCGWQNARVLIMRTCDRVTLQGRRNFAGVINLRVLTWENDPGLSRWAQCNHKVPYKREPGSWKEERHRRLWRWGLGV